MAASASAVAAPAEQRVPKSTETSGQAGALLAAEIFGAFAEDEGHGAAGPEHANPAEAENQAAVEDGADPTVTGNQEDSSEDMSDTESAGLPCRSQVHKKTVRFLLHGGEERNAGKKMTRCEKLVAVLWSREVVMGTEQMKQMHGHGTASGCESARSLHALWLRLVSSIR